MIITFAEFINLFVLCFGGCYEILSPFPFMLWVFWIY